ncbi:hypothetical protein Tco_1499931 [Tanacetum coccineum]
MFWERLLPHAKDLRFESLCGVFPSKWEYEGFCPIDASIRGLHGLPFGQRAQSITNAPTTSRAVALHTGTTGPVESMNNYSTYFGPLGFPSQQPCPLNSVGIANVPSAQQQPLMGQASVNGSNGFQFAQPGSTPVPGQEMILPNAFSAMTLQDPTTLLRIWIQVRVLTSMS